MRMQSTHVTTVNGFTKIPLDDSEGPVSNTLAGMLGRLNGTSLFSLALWKLPAGAALGDASATRAADENYLQSAGSATAMSIELRRTVDGVASQFAVGSSSSSATNAPWVSIPFGQHTLEVQPNEVFSAEEAAAIYLAYYETGEIPKGLALRELDLGL